MYSKVLTYRTCVNHPSINDVPPNGIAYFFGSSKVITPNPWEYAGTQKRSWPVTNRAAVIFGIEENWTVKSARECKKWYLK